MKNKPRGLLQTCVILLFFLGALSSLPACSRSGGNSTGDVKMEGQSGNWKVTVLSVKKIPKRPDLDPRQYPSSQYELLEVVFNAELLGSGGKIPIPRGVLIDDKGQKSEMVAASQALPDRISKMEEGVAKEGEMDKFLNCFSSETQPCPLTTGEKLSITNSFVDPKEYANLKLIFGDVPPIPLKVSAGDIPKTKASPSY